MRTGLTRWTPGGRLAADRISRLFDDAFGDFLTPLDTGEEVSNRNWVPAVDIRESDEELTLFAELPGLSKDDIHIGLENNVLTLTGERKYSRDEKTENYHRIERAYGTFSRSFTLPRNLNTDKVSASFEDGVLTISLPKAEESKPRQIAIK